MRCGTKNVPGVYARVRHYLDWIVEEVEKMESWKVYIKKTTSLTKCIIKWNNSSFGYLSYAYLYDDILLNEEWKYWYIPYLTIA